jgi:CheY-like chemotaxis protein
MASPGRPRVVVVDDHPAVLEASANMLNQKFTVVGTATTGAAAVRCVADLNPDVVVMDVAMPELNGFQAWSQIRLNGSKARVVFLSNFAGEDFVLAALRDGASAFVDKSRMQRDLIAAVGHALSGRSWTPHCGVLPRWRPRTGRAHDVQFYRSDAFLVHAVASFFESALDEGDAVVSIASEPHRRALETEFSARGFDVRELETSARYSPLDSAAALDAVLVNGGPNRDRFYSLLDPIVERARAASTIAHVTVFGEVAPILCAAGRVEEMTELEAIADEFVASRGISLLCAYSTEYLHDDETGLMNRICDRHAAIVPALA